MVCYSKMNRIFAKKCLVIIFSSLSSVHPPPPLSRVWMLGACLELEDVTLFLWSLLSQEEFSQQPAPSHVAGTIEWLASAAEYLQAVCRQWATARPAWPSHCSPGLEREFLLHSILNSLASGDRGARTSAVCTQPQICHSSALLGQT